MLSLNLPLTLTPTGGASVFGTVTINGTRGVQTLQMGDLGQP